MADRRVKISEDLEARSFSRKSWDRSTHELKSSPSNAAAPRPKPALKPDERSIRGQQIERMSQQVNK